jgi:hypothetical protein
MSPALRTPAHPLQPSHDPRTGEVLRRLLARDATDPVDPWLEFSQQGCCYSFGSHGQPLPVGALRILWAHGYPFTQECPQCGGPLRMIFFGGLLVVGGGGLVCSGCDARFFQPIGNLHQVADLVRESGLRGTEFAVKSMFYGAPVPSAGLALLEALGMDAER